MERKVFLEENRSRNSVNKSNTIGVELLNDTKTLRGNGVSGEFSVYEQYNAERDACDKYRMILVVNPICTNVLHNVLTEVVQNEGSENVVVLNDNNGISRRDIKKENGLPASGNVQNTSPLTRIQAIRDTEYSHKENGGFVYHCGTDIFNNHMLRSNGFVHVNKMNNVSIASATVYNTIKDTLRDGEGNIVKMHTTGDNSTQRTDMHLYMIDNCSTLKDAYVNKIGEENGWIGFTNPGNIEIPNSDNSGVTINRMMAGNNPCEFIDMYPDRTLFSFVPKYNKFRKRVEKNWDYCLTYPFSSDTNMVDNVCGGIGGSIWADIVSINGNTVLCRSLFKHTLSVNSFINLYYYKSETVDGETKDVFKRFPIKIKIVSVGNVDGSSSDRYFSVRYGDIVDIYESIEDGFFYKKVESNSECQYYFRLFKKLKYVNEDGIERDIDSDVNKLAYSENIYGDRMAQIVFTDDIDLSDVYDNHGRRVKDLYFTVVKRNAGYKEWYYNVGGSYSSSAVEFSHCFGKVTAGVDFGMESGTQVDYNIHYLHNIPLNIKNVSAYGATILVGQPEKINDTEKGITIDDDIYYGDVVEFSPYNYTETVISPVLYRFNTAQREYTGTTYGSFIYDKLVSDDYDFRTTTTGFTVSAINMSYYSGVSMNANVCPEGYFYNPHTKITVRDENDNVERRKPKLVNYQLMPSEEGYIFGTSDNDRYTQIQVSVPTDYSYMMHDVIAFCSDGGIVEDRYDEPQVVWGEIVGVSGMLLTIKFDGRPFGNSDEDVKNVLVSGPGRKFKAFYSEYAIPTYATFDTSSRNFVWRSLLSPSLVPQDRETHDMTFANGRFYVEKNITFFLRRQDPFADFGLLWAKGLQRTNPMEFFRLESSESKLDLSSIYDFYDKLNNICY